MMEYKDINAIMTIFAEKILFNLAYTSFGAKEQGEQKDLEQRQILVSTSLDVLATYTGSSQSCKLLGGTDIMRQLVKSGLSDFPVLQEPNQMKQLGQFYRVLMNLWLQEDFLESFDDNVSQLCPTINEILQFQDNH